MTIIVPPPIETAVQSPLGEIVPMTRHGNRFTEGRLRGCLDGGRRDDRHQTSRASKSIRGSTHM